MSFRRDMDATFDEVCTHFDAICQRFDKLVSETNAPDDHELRARCGPLQPSVTSRPAGFPPFASASKPEITSNSSASMPLWR